MATDSSVNTPDTTLSLSNSDIEIIDELTQSPHISNMDLAKKLGLSSKTIAKRIRNLQDNNILRITARQDIRMLGYNKISTATIHNPSHALVAALKTQPYVLTITKPMFENSILLMTCHSDLKVHCNNLYELISMHSENSLCEINECFQIHKFIFNSSFITGETLPSEVEQQYQNCYKRNCDETDYKIIQHLVADARQSNRAIGRQINVSESSVRKRINALFDNNLIRIGAVVNGASRFADHTVTSGELAIAPARINEAFDYFRQHENVIMALQTSGKNNAIIATIFKGSGQAEEFASKLETFGTINRMRQLSPIPLLFRHEFMPIT